MTQALNEVTDLLEEAENTIAKLTPPQVSNNTNQVMIQITQRISDYKAHLADAHMVAVKILSNMPKQPPKPTPTPLREANQITAPTTNSQPVTNMSAEFPDQLKPMTAEIIQREQAPQPQIPSAYNL